MAGSTISGTIANTVTLGSASYPSPLTVTGTGAVLVSAYGSIGVDGPGEQRHPDQRWRHCRRRGHGRQWHRRHEGGHGRRWPLPAQRQHGNNDGLIVGGGGGRLGGGSGGAGAYVGTGAALTNQATLPAASVATPRRRSPAVSGAGVVLHGGILTNSGAIEGGYTNGDDGSGVVALAGTLINTGIISGGTGVSKVRRGRRRAAPASTVFQCDPQRRHHRRQ